MGEKEYTLKSIFKQNIYRYVYKADIFKAVVKDEDIHLAPMVNIEKDKEFVETKSLYTCNLKLPVLNINDEFYITELNKAITIQNRIRCSDGSVIYTFDECIEDKISKQSKLDAEKDKKRKMKELLNSEHLERTNKMMERKLHQLDRQLYEINKHWLLKRMIKLFRI